MDFLSTTIAISTALVIFAIVRTRLCTEKKKRYHPVVTTCVHTLINFNRLHDYIAELGHKNKTFRALNLIVNYVFTVDPANVEYILKTNFVNYGRVCTLYIMRLIKKLMLVLCLTL